MSRRNITSVEKDYRPLVRAAVDAGWELTQTRHGHAKLTAPDGYSTPIPGSSGSAGLVKGIAARLRKRGVDV